MMSRFTIYSLRRLARLAALTAPLMGMAVGLGAVAVPAAHAQEYALAEFSKVTEPAIIIPHMTVTVQRYTRYRPDANKEPIYGQWSWCPRFKFGLRGPIVGGSQVVVNISKPNGQPWLSLPITDTPELAPGAWKDVMTDDQEETKAITQAGVCPFTIVLKNPLDNSKKVLYSGKIDVSKLKHEVGTKPGETEFFINHDWFLPTGYLQIDTDINEEAPLLSAYFWFKGDTAVEPSAYVYYNGKLIYSTKVEGQGRGTYDLTLTTPGVDKKLTWFRWKFEFGGVLVYRRLTDQSANNYTQFFLDKNPGAYEIKILRAGQLCRSMKFTVGADGKIVDNNIAKNNHYSTTWLFVPVQVFPGTDGAVASAPSPGAFYGDPPRMK